MTEQIHRPVLLHEVVDLLNIKPDGCYVDGTLGLGGHAEAILKKLGPQGRLLGLDVDDQALALAKDRLQPFGDQTITRQVNFRGLQGVLDELGWKEVDGLVFDLGVSSLQLDDPGRGFSFQKEGPLDMRLGSQQVETVLSFLERSSEKELMDLFTQFGEGRNAKRLSRYLKSDVAQGKIKTTTELAGFCVRVLGRHGAAHPATRVFLALRSAVNQELDALKDFLQRGPRYLNKGGRLAVVSFHSLEDRLVKESFRNLGCEGLDNKTFSVLTKKPIGPTPAEIKDNPRSRSAKLRVIERTS